jgi:hypothetical protein
MDLSRHLSKQKRLTRSRDMVRVQLASLLHLNAKPLIADSDWKVWKHMMIFTKLYLQLAHLHCVGRKVLGSAPLCEGKLSAKLRVASGGAAFEKGFAVFCLATGSAQADCFGSLVRAAAAASFALLAAPPMFFFCEQNRGASHIASCDSSALSRAPLTR